MKTELSNSKPDATTKADGLLSNAYGEFQDVLSDIEDLVKTTTSLTGEDLTRAKAKISERVASAKQTVALMAGAITDRARKTVKVTDGYVHEQPWQSIGIGAALGLLVGFVLARRA